MKNIFFAILLFASTKVFSQAAKENKNDCNLAVTYSEMAYKNFKEASKAQTIEQSTTLLEEGVKNATEASAYAIQMQCNCPNAKNYALNAVNFGNKALKENDYKKRIKFTKNAMNMSLDVMTAVPNCK